MPAKLQRNRKLRRPASGFRIGAQVEIRCATPEDAAEISRVLHKSFAEFRALYTERSFAATTPKASQICDRMAEGPVWIALHEGAIVGTVAAIVKGESAYVRGMAVLPAARGTGTGSAVLKQVEEWAHGKGCTRLFLSTTPFLAAAIRLYEKAGFRRIAEGPHDLYETPLFTMEKKMKTRARRGGTVS